MQRYKTFLVLNGALILFLILMLWIKPINSLRRYNIYNHSGNGEDYVMIYGDRSLTQVFECHAIADAFEINVAPANDSFSGYFNVKMIGPDDRQVQVWTTDKLDTAEGWVQYRLRGSVVEPNSTYKLIISAPELDVSGAIKVFTGNKADSVSGIGDLIYRQKLSEDPVSLEDAVLCFGVYKNYTNIFAVIAIIVLFLVANTCCVFKNKGIDWVALPILIGIGSIMILIMAPGSGPDDTYHYYSSFELSNIMLGRQNVCEIENRYYDALPVHHNTNEAFVKTYEEIRYRIQGEEGTFIFDGSKDKLMQPLSHLAPALGMTIGRLLNMNFIQIYTLARMSNMCFYIILIFLAVRIVPVNKELMLMLGIIPMAMHQAAQLSYDAVVNGMSFLFVAYVFRLICDERSITWKNVAVFITLSGLMGPIKIIYFLIVMILFIIPEDKFSSRKDRIFKISLTFLGAIICVLGSRINDISYALFRTGVVVSTDKWYTMSFVVSNPIRFLKLVFSSIENSFWSLMKGMIGGSLSGMTLNVSEYLVIGFMFMIVLCALSEDVAVIKTPLQKSVVVVIVLFGVFITATVFAFSSTPYGSTYIEGFQGRYLLPFFPLFMYMFCGMKSKMKIDRYNLFYPICFIELGYIISVMNTIDF